MLEDELLERVRAEEAEEKDDSNCMVISGAFEELIALGRGPARDTRLAATYIRHLLESRWTQRDIIKFLEFYGFTNPAETVGR